MYIRIYLIIATFLSLHGVFSQQPSTAPNFVTDLYYANTSLWTIGESSQFGQGIYKYVSPNWFYFGNPGAEKITASASGNPLFIDQNNNLFEFNAGKWNQIQQNVTDISGSNQSSLIWAIVNDELMFYNENKWSKSEAPKMNIKDLAVVNDNSIYVLHSSGNIFRLNAKKWDLFGTKKGSHISATNNSTLYLSQEMINPGIPNVNKCFTTPKWLPTPFTGTKITHDKLQKVYYIDPFNRLMMISNNTTTELTNSSINLTSNNNITYNNNPNAIDSISGESAIFSAVRNNDLTSLYSFLTKGADINIRNKKNETPLLLASNLGRTQIAIKIAEISFWKPTIVPNMEQRDNNSKNALWYAVKNRDTLLVSSLLDRGANPQSLDMLTSIVDYPSYDKQKKTLINLFVERGVSPNSQQLLKTIQLNHEDCFLKLENALNGTPLTVDNYNEFLNEAIIVKNKNIAKHCVNKGGDANLLTTYALEKSDKDLMIFCLDKGAKADPFANYAIEKNDKDFLTLCVDKYQCDKNKALLTCCNLQKSDYAMDLLEKGADANFPMLEMINKQDSSFVKLLLKYNANANNPDFINKAIEKKAIKLIEMLLENGADANNGIIKAIETQSLEITSILLPLSDTTNEELIHTASSRENIEILKLLLRTGGLPQNGMVNAVNANKIENVKLLLENGALVNSDELVLSAISNNSLKMVNILVENGANVSVGLELAVTKNAHEIVKFLLKNGAEILDSNKYIFTAVNNNFPKTLKVLTDNGLPIDFTDEKDNTMLHLSCKKSFFDITRIIIDIGTIDVNSYNKYGLTPLMLVVTSNNKDVNFCKLLVENGANVNAKNNNGVIVRKMAKGLKVKKYLKNNGARKR